MGNAVFRVCQHRDPLTDFQKKLAQLITSGTPPHMQVLGSVGSKGACLRMREIVTVRRLFFSFLTFHAHQGWHVATGGYIGIYTLPKSGQVNFHGVTMTSARITYCETQWVLKFYTSPKQISGYAPDAHHYRSARWRLKWRAPVAFTSFYGFVNKNIFPYFKPKNVKNWELWTAITLASLKLRTSCLHQTGGFGGRAIEWCHSNLPQTDPCCHGNQS